MDQGGAQHQHTDADLEAAIEDLKWLCAPTEYAVPYVRVMPVVFELRRQQAKQGMVQ